MGVPYLSGIALLLAILLRSPSAAAAAAADDVKYLQAIKSAVTDPHDSLASWEFTNTTAGFICNFRGVTCWNQDENRLLKLDLSNLGLSGPIFDSLRFCTSNSILGFLLLRGNSFAGPIPSSICSSLRFLVSIDLSHNQLTGEIPSGIGKCGYLNDLDLSDNRLHGRIPSQLASISRLRGFSVADNNLRGRIPSGLARFGRAAFDGNLDLCGEPLYVECQSHLH